MYKAVNSYKGDEEGNPRRQKKVDKFALMELLKSLEQGTEGSEVAPQGRKFSEYHTGATFENQPQIDIEYKKVMTGESAQGEAKYSVEPQFFVEGKPVSSKDAMYFYDRSQEGVQGAKSFNDFVSDYTSQYHKERQGASTASGPAQSRSRVTKKKEAGSKGLLEALNYYKNAPSNMKFEE